LEPIKPAPPVTTYAGIAILQPPGERGAPNRAG
jgi:hypothetical protein